MGPLAPGGLVCHSAAVKPLLNRGSPPLAGVTSHRRRPSSRYTGWPARAGRVLPLLHNDSLASVTHPLRKRQGVGVEFSRRLRLDFSSSTGWAGGAEIAGLEGLIFRFSGHFRSSRGSPAGRWFKADPPGGSTWMYRMGRRSGVGFVDAHDIRLHYRHGLHQLLQEGPCFQLALLDELCSMRRLFSSMRR